jgi:enediyne biosynthesis protein E4
MHKTSASLLSLSVILFLLADSCKRQQPQTLFKLLPSSETGINFDNVVTENDSVNPLDLEYLYNGAGVAVGDFNRDGLPDLYFTSSTGSNKLYLNMGHMRFKDVTAEAGVGGEGRWSSSATVVDINNDGWPDIYVCATVKKNPLDRANLLYINQGLDKNGVPVFKEMAKEYGLADTGHSVVADFFDYDHDGDLDMYLVETSPAGRESSSFYGPMSQFSGHNSDKLYRNDWSDSLHHPVFTDVSDQAGIHDNGYGLSVDVADFNHDGWPDIYVDNDFMTSDLLYINNHNGTFTNEIKKYFKHTSESAMGSDVEDINNDGWPDLMSVDMDPQGNYRKKKNMVSENYQNYLNMIAYGYVIQYARNTLQINQGPAVGENDTITHSVFSDLGYLAGVAETDWSWTPSIADFDNDGLKDIIITNGYPRDVTDHDFITYKENNISLASKQMILDQIPSIRVPNYAFKNMGNLHFKNVTKEWGLDTPSFSSGGVFVDLDNDGDLDYVVNNINGKAFIYENMLNNGKIIRANFLRVKFIGSKNNIDGIGTTVELHYDQGRLQTYYNTTTRGYLGCVEPIAHFGLGKIKTIDTVLIKWPNGKIQLLRNVAANQLLTVNIKNAVYPLEIKKIPGKNLSQYDIDTTEIKYLYKYPLIDTSCLFTNITHNAGIHYVHEEKDFVDFNIQKLLPHKFSQYGPGIAVGDIDGNGLDDIILGASKGYTPQVLLQQPDGKFIQKDFTGLANTYNKNIEDRGVLLFDADGDGDLDLYLAAGSDESPPGSPDYQDQFYENIGHGHFRLDTAALPVNHTSKSCVIAADFNHDGKLDLFVAGRVIPGEYPKPVSSMILRNDSKDGKIKFTDVTDQVAPMLKNIGMVTDAIWTDFNNDGWPDLILVGEWMPVTFLENDHGHFVNVTDQTGIQNEIGWWNSIVSGDFNNDGKIDYVVGNLGLNSFYRASHEYPAGVYAKDFESNGVYDAIPTIYMPGPDGKMHEYPTEGRDDMIKQMPGIRRQFPTYKSFALATIQDILSPEELKGALVLHANNFNSCYIENMGNGKFKMEPLPLQAQVAPIYGMVTGDFNGDGNLDLALCGNDYGTEVNTGRYDALNGLVLLGNGKNSFKPLTILQSGLYIPGDAKGMVKIMLGKKRYGIAATQNQGPLELFQKKESPDMIRLRPDDVSVLLHFKNGQVRKEEFYYGSSFLSQSSRFVSIDKNLVSSVDIINGKGEKRTISFH